MRTKVNIPPPNLGADNFGLDGTGSSARQQQEHILTVGAEQSWQRLDVFLGQSFSGSISREKLKKAVQNGAVRINGAVCASPSVKVQAGDTVNIVLAPQNVSAAAEYSDLNALYHDKDIAVLDKPAGLTVHPCPSCPEGTLVNRLLAYFPELAQQGGERPGIVHRLDKDTSGLLLVALREEARLVLVRAFAERAVKKEYLAIVYGVPAREADSINLPIGRHDTRKTEMAVRIKNGHEAISEYRVLYADPGRRFSLLAVKIHTGRTHQIRVHLKYIGHPIIGDSTYFDALAVKSFLGLALTRAELDRFLGSIAARQLLHAWKLEFTHPSAGKNLNFCSPPPEDFLQAAQALSTQMQPVVITGNPGCGKSTVLELLQHKGIPVWSADHAAARLYEVGADGWHMFKSRFGSRFFMDEHGGRMDKAALFTAMRHDGNLRREVEMLIHPLIWQNLFDFMGRHNNLHKYAPLCVAEIPLYFESAGSMRRDADMSRSLSRPVVVGIHCPFAIRAERLKKSRGWTEDRIQTMESWQWDEGKKMQFADLVLDNSESAEKLASKTEELLARLQSMRKERLDKILLQISGIMSCNAN